ncbi:hypothetical protein [Hahella chejuensis]|uniref:hypothetical protein n=1 Tax=Hahella chejuensis TaxID=158327 RepID=UPI0011D03ADE|nr:hypothetical protein [Hahella chejuensis]
MDDLRSEGKDFIFIYVEEDTSRTTLTLTGKRYSVEIMTSATYTKTMDKQELLDFIRNFEYVRGDPEKYSFCEEDVY